MREYLDEGEAERREGKERGEKREKRKDEALRSDWGMKMEEEKAVRGSSTTVVWYST